MEQQWSMLIPQILQTTVAEFRASEVFQYYRRPGGILGVMIWFNIFFIASGVGLSPLYCGHFWPIVLAPDDR
jgi:hypothetical protein